MAKSVTIGGDRLGSGKKMKVDLKTFNRSTHDLSYTWKSSMACGTLVPFMGKIATPGDTFDINLFADVLTLPTIGPLFGSYKLQLDVFCTPIRIYNAKMQLNLQGVGNKVSNIALPQLEILANPHVNLALPIDNQQINQSCILHYLGSGGR